MAQTTQQPILKMEIIDNCICTQHLVGGGESLGLSHRVGAIQSSHGRKSLTPLVSSVEAISDAVGASCFMLDVDVELLHASMWTTFDGGHYAIFHVSA
jgi:hypothetical protein